MKYFTALLMSIAMIFSLANLSYAQSAQGNGHGLKVQVEQLKTEVTTLQNQVNTLQNELKSVIALAPYVSVDQNAENGLAGPNIVFKDANVHIESGSGATVDSSGLGNLVIGYDEDNANSPIDSARTGSNNLIIGPGHEFTASGALLAGYQNVSTSNYTVAEGECDAAGASASSSCVGVGPDLATGEADTVSGGAENTASGLWASVSGGVLNTASGTWSSVSGGEGNTASGGGAASVSGGEGNTASGETASVSGGDSNTASGDLSSVSGGGNNDASAFESSVSGGAMNTASGQYSSVGGGENQAATELYQNIN